MVPNLDYLSIQGESAGQHSTLGARPGITGQEEVDVSIRNAQHHRVLILVGIQWLGRVEHQCGDFSPGIALTHSDRGRDHPMIG